MYYFDGMSIHLVKEGEMTGGKKQSVYLGGTSMPLPCFFPSVSSVKTNLMPVDYIELLTAASYPLYLLSAYDIASSTPEHQTRISDALKKSRKQGSVILMDSGKYESFWKAAADWRVESFHAMISSYEHDIAFCYDNQSPPQTVDAIAEDAVKSVLRDQEYSTGTVVPIVHGPTALLPRVAQKVAEELCPILLAIPERALGEGIVARAATVRKIRSALNALGFYCPLHLLGTGNPISIIAYTMAGADSFDGLEWCQTVVDHNTAFLYHFQQWDFVRLQTEWGSNGALPYIQSVLMHNLEFFSAFMSSLQDATIRDTLDEVLARYLPEERCMIIRNAIQEAE